MKAEVWLSNLATKPYLFVLLLSTSFMLNTAKSVTAVYSFSFPLTGFDNSSAIRGLTGFTLVNSGMPMTMQRCFWGHRLSCSKSDLE